MYPAIIEDYQRPGTLQEAIAILSSYEPGDAIFMAGGQSVMQAMKSRMVRPRCVVDLQAIAELKGITTDSALHTARHNTTWKTSPTPGCLRRHPRLLAAPSAAFAPSVRRRRQPRERARRLHPLLGGRARVALRRTQQ